MALSRPSPNNAPPAAPEGMRWVWHAAGAEWVLDAALPRLSWWELNRGEIPGVLKAWAKYIAICLAVLIAVLVLVWAMDATRGPNGPVPDDPPQVCSQAGMGYC